MRNSGSRKRKAEEEEQFVYSDVEIEELETFYGFVDTIEDCLVILQACRTGILNRVTSRLSESQRVGIRSGSVFVFNETESHIKRWTDGRTWSPSRVLGQFLIYRELQRKNPITVTTEVVRDHTDIATVPDTYVQDLQIPVGSDAAPESGPYSKRELRNHERPDYNEDGSEGDEQGSSGAGSPTSSVSKGYSGDSSSSSRAQTVPDDSVYELSDSSLRKKKGFRSSGMDLATLTEMHMPMPFLGAAASMFTYKVCQRQLLTF
ncbi:hypothetical protein M427DRAFT_96024 [Gonapodya prolifera JEL478]|uniref:Gti1/Pac2 family-domain-containing protein n=1 Tax=Gonapodya prolifera (strain JEL478) TaxID=1344416 RepID=A0A139AP44_GONPJ|nr:hypothetical protein M427DRAFT_96024 [Gonapodya prolifera JEL478]|eukprot:KXS18527.1 hypothetical protein M427DRAFT_96024 [Gonapodya prolifera JEL478]